MACNGEGKASLNHQRFWCAHAQEDRGNYSYRWLPKKRKSVKSSSKQTKRQPYRFSKCSGIPTSWRGVVYGVPGSKTNGQWQQIGHKVPFQVYAVPFPFPSVPAALRCSPKPQLQHFQLFSLEKRMMTATNVNNERIRLRILSVHSGKVVPPLAPTDHAGSVLLSTCSVPTCYHFSPI